MLIDLHMHLFPDVLARRTLPHLAEICKSPYHTDGTVSGTLSAMRDWKVDRGVVLHIATQERHTRTVNDFAAQIQRDHPEFICFGSVYPGGDRAIDELHLLKERGLHGVKLHPPYQKFFADEERYFPLYAEIAKLQLPVTFHAGWDPVSPIDYASAERLGKVARAFPNLTIIAAHMGAMRQPEEAVTHLAGLPNVYVDTAMSSLLLQPEPYERLIRLFGVDHVLFGTDCPWNTAPNELGLLEQTGLSPDELEQIKWKNAVRLLRLAL